MESLIRTQAQAQVAAGHRVDVVVVNHLTPDGKDVLGAAFGVTSRSTESDGRVTVHRIGRIGNLAKYDVTLGLRRALQQIALEKPDVWHLHTPNVTMVLGLQSLLEVCQPLVVTHHSDIVNQKVLRPAYETVERRVYRRAKLILSDSPNYIEGSSQLRPYLDKVEVLPIGVNVLDYQYPSDEVLEWERRYRLEFEQPIWLSVGRLASYKGLEIAIQALVTTPGQLVIIGSGPCEASWKKLSVQLGVADRIHWLGRCSESQLKGAYRAATALWFPSNARNEGFGIVQVEAMASGCPVINTDLPHSGVSWVSPHEQTGLTVPVNDPSALSKAAHRIWQEPMLRDRLSVAARVQSADRFDQQMLNDRCLEHYQRATSSGVRGLF